MVSTGASSLLRFTRTTTGRALAIFPDPMRPLVPTTSALASADLWRGTGARVPLLPFFLPITFTERMYLVSRPPSAHGRGAPFHCPRNTKGPASSEAIGFAPAPSSRDLLDE